jgi:hypothetical protein
MSVWEHLSDPEVFGQLVQHPNHPGVVRTVRELIAELRSTSRREELRSVQEKLVAALAEAERRFGEARRLMKRGDGDPIDEAFWRRTCAQLRTVGDAVAWRFIDYRRQWIYLFGANQAPGLLTGKAGFDDEWQLFQGHWDVGEPALLTGATNCIRLGDLLVAKGDKLEAIEVKRDPRRFRGAQKRRLRELERQVNEGAPVTGPGGPGWILESSVPYETHWTGAERHLESAFRDGFASWVPEEGVGVMFFAWRAAALAGQERALAAQSREQVKAAASLGSGQHSIVIKSFNYPFLSRWAAPITIFPMSPNVVSLLLTGELMATVEIRVEAMVEALRAEGLDARNLLEGHPTDQPLPPRLVLWRKPRPGSVLKATMEQFGIELTVLGAWARAVASAPRPDDAPQRWIGHLCLAQEGRVWA